MGERFAPSIAGNRHAHQAGIEAVLHVAEQHAVLDQRGALGGIAFVVDIERAAPLRQRAVVDHGDARRRHALADAAGKCRTALAVEIAFQSVTHRFVQQDAGPARPQYDGHVAGRRGLGRKIDNRLVHRLARVVLQACRR